MIMVVWTFTEIVRACVVGVFALIVVGYIIYGILLVIVVAFVAKTNVVVDHEDIKKKLSEIKHK